jgi:hypothetical protein
VARPLGVRRTSSASLPSASARARGLSARRVARSLPAVALSLASPGSGSAGALAPPASRARGPPPQLLRYAPSPRSIRRARLSPARRCAVARRGGERQRRPRRYAYKPIKSNSKDNRNRWRAGARPARASCHPHRPGAVAGCQGPHSGPWIRTRHRREGRSGAPTAPGASLHEPRRKKAARPPRNRAAIPGPGVEG